MLFNIDLAASTVAERAGIPLKRRGGRQWAHCPFHGDKTPSMAFFENGRFYCFSCNAHGDAIDLHAQLNGLSLVEAARELQGSAPAKAANTKAQQARQLQRMVEAYKRQENDRLSSILHRANADICRLSDTIGINGLESERLCAALRAREAAIVELYYLDLAEPKELLGKAVNT